MLKYILMRYGDNYNRADLLIYNAPLVVFFRSTEIGVSLLVHKTLQLVEVRQLDLGQPA